MAACDKCSFDYFQVIAEFYNNDAKSLSFLRSHSVSPSEIICPHCSSQCSYREDQRVWRCRKSSVIPKTKKRRYCDFSVSDSKGTFLDHSYIAPWKVLLVRSSRDGVKVRAVFIIIIFFFYCVLFLFFPVHLHLDLIVLLRESRLILGWGGGGGGGGRASPLSFFIKLIFWGPPPPLRLFNY